MKDISTEELLKLLNETKSSLHSHLPPKLYESKSKENRDVLYYIKNNNIEPGENKVPTYVIYYDYVMYARKSLGRVWGKEEFFRTFKMYFKPKRNGNQRFYMVNEEFANSKELNEKAKEYDKRWQKRKNSSK